MKTQSSTLGNIGFKEFKMALLLLSWKTQDDRRWCRWTKNEATIIVDKRTSKPTLTEYTKGARHQTWHRSFQNYGEAYDYIVNHF